jgi:agmatinase
MRTFAGIEPRFAEYDNAAILLQSIPYDGTSTWGKGADSGFEAFVEASENMELYDIETNSEVYRRGVHMLPALTESSSPEAMFQAVYENTKKLIRTGKFLTFFGGEHSISIGILKALYEAYPGITVLQMDAHTDLRPEYHGTPYNHACALYDASRNTNLVQVGIRSMDKAEMQFVNRSACFFAEEIYGSHSWMSKALDLMTDPVYITFDLDAFDPGIMPATGTPEPGGLDWNTTITFLRQVFEQRKVIGFDIVELAPDPHHKASNFLAAKLYYKMLSYAFEIK